MVKKKDILDTERTIEFYQIVQMAAGEPAFDLDTFYKALKHYPDKDRVTEVKSNNETFHCLIEKDKHLLKVIIGITRSRQRPGLVDSQSGQIEGQPLAPNKEVLEYSHMLIFPSGFVGIEYNMHGPRLSQFTFFLDELASGLGRLVFNPCVNNDFEENLKNAPALKRISFRVTENNLDMFKKINPDFDEATFDRTGAYAIIETYIAPRNQDTLRDLAKKCVKFLVKQKEPEVAMKELGLKFEGPNPNAVKGSIINLLNAKITAKRTIQLESDRRLKKDDAFNQIRDAYDEVEEKLLECMTVDVEDE